MSFALNKSPSKQNGRSSKDHADSDLLLGRQRISGSPEIQFRPEFAYKTYELNASFSASAPISPLKTNGNLIIQCSSSYLSKQDGECAALL